MDDRFFGSVENAFLANLMEDGIEEEQYEVKNPEQAPKIWIGSGDSGFPQHYH